MSSCETTFTCPRCGGERVIEVGRGGFSISGNYDCDVAHRDEDYSGMWTAYAEAQRLLRKIVAGEKASA